ncbi:MAG TPA: deoxyribose-phosphate aldolase [Chloroflexus aurantiacus]|uniref:Deoxyribose-phosphate aldolase n=1 Tax=Chloroflexus aurantiacus (strain ATCC 29366 / DSM 635 / J-10-fl) TaxID=324602 RepID=A9WFK2_CHLAA|nr:deoxyribose-phosphate aldolase [Chloroflexus aurantiacus J-10-fl]HBW65808.1 deoxyribose-phosphate aldolase [Chloroflexus aurantiacus]
MEDLIAQVRSHIDALVGLPVGTPLAHPPVPPASDTPIASFIDHTLLKPEATVDQIDRLCSEAERYRFASVCVNPRYVERCARALSGSAVRVCTVIGFPLGATTTKVKVFETVQAIGHGAREVDMVLAIGALRGREYHAVVDDIRAVTDAAHASGVLVKVILETGLLTDFEKVMACMLAVRAGADFVKTSTGFGPGGATVADIRLMRAAVGPTIGVKASGGVRSLAMAQELIAAGATRIGTSAGVAIVQEAEGTNLEPRNSDTY